MLLNSHSALQEQTILHGRNRHYYYDTPPSDLSIKTMSNGHAIYEIDGGRFAVEENTYLLLNNRQPYQITIESPTIVESFCIFFPQGWAEDVLQVMTKQAETLLDDPLNQAAPSIHVFERIRPLEGAVQHALQSLKADLMTESVSALKLQEHLHRLLALLLQVENDRLHEINRIPAIRASTRAELYQRLYRARDYIHAELAAPLDLTEIAGIAYLSPYHFLRMFKEAFGQTPHDYLTTRRIERAQFLLTRTHLPITEICFEVGFQSLGSFSSKFRQRVGFSPREYRQQFLSPRSIPQF